jgi:hypothetical protein
MVKRGKPMASVEVDDISNGPLRIETEFSRSDSDRGAVRRFDG